MRPGIVGADHLVLRQTSIACHGQSPGHALALRSTPNHQSNRINYPIQPPNDSQLSLALTSIYCIIVPTVIKADRLQVIASLSVWQNQTAVTIALPKLFLLFLGSEFVFKKNNRFLTILVSRFSKPIQIRLM